MRRAGEVGGPSTPLLYCDREKCSSWCSSAFSAVDHDVYSCTAQRLNATVVRRKEPGTPRLPYMKAAREPPACDSRTLKVQWGNRPAVEHPWHTKKALLDIGRHRSLSLSG